MCVLMSFLYHQKEQAFICDEIDRVLFIAREMEKHAANCPTCKGIIEPTEDVIAHLFGIPTNAKGEA